MMRALGSRLVKDAPLARREAAGLWPVLEKPRPQGRLAGMRFKVGSGGGPLIVCGLQPPPSRRGARRATSPCGEDLKGTKGLGPRLPRFRGDERRGWAGMGRALA